MLRTSQCSAFYSRKLSGSSFKHPKFRNCCFNGQLRPHLELGISNYNFLTRDGEPRHSLPLEVCPSCEHEIPKVLPTFSRPPQLPQELVISNSRQALHFRKCIQIYNGTMAMASVRANLVSRGLGPVHITR